MIAKKHVVEGKTIIAVCDLEILGKKFEEGEKMLDLSNNFYKGNKVSKENFLRMLSDGYLVNAVGKKSIEFLRLKKVIDDSNILFIDGVPYAQVIIKN